MTKPIALTLTAITDDDLLHRLSELLRDSRRTESDLVAHVGEVDRRRLYAREASPSMFAYCTRVLHLSGAETYLRITAARAARQHPVLLAMLADGRLHLSGIAKLAPHLTPENRDAILGRATHRSKRQIEELIAEIRPRLDAPSLVRKLPDARHAERRLPPVLLGARGDEAATVMPAAPGGPRQAGEPLEAGVLEIDASRGAGVAGIHPRVAAGSMEMSAAEELRPDGVGAAGPLEPVGPPRAEPLELGRHASRAVIEPLAPSRYKVQFTASTELRDKLERLQALLRAELPGGDLGAVIDHAVSETLQRLEARRYARTGTPRRATTEGAGVPRSSRTPPQGASKHSRHVPASIRRAVHERDEGRCRYVDESGRRCLERHRLEYHHSHPFGMGGGHTLGNVRLLCRAHNLYLAEHDYGRRAIDRHRRQDQEPARRQPDTA